MVGAVAFIGTLIVYSGIPAGQLGKAHENLAREVEELQCADVSDGSDDSEPAEEKAGKSSEEIIDSLYIKTFGRMPTQTEKNQLVAKINTDQKQSREDLEDLFWALLNAKEFMFNH